MTISFKEWQQRRLAKLRELEFPLAGKHDVTVLIYHYRDIDQFDLTFDAVECALYETWLNCGKLKTSLVLNRMTPYIEKFVACHNNTISVHLSPVLIPGSVPSMSVDCNSNLHSYFDTPEVLVIQNDGYPLQKGLKEFIGRYDYTGAPFVRKTPFNRALGIWPSRAVGNGGFSLRSKKICELASFYWNRRYSKMPQEWRIMREDIFYCLLLPMLEPSYRKAIDVAPLQVATRFSYDDLYGAPPDELPFGFHGQNAFNCFWNLGMLSD